MSTPLAVVDIVDDDAYLLREPGRVLSARGYRVSMFMSAGQYLKTLDEGKASCVVIDVDLAGRISGLELGTAIFLSRRPIPIIFISGTLDATARAQASSMGCVAWIEKPVSSELLISAIRRAGAPSR
jgi:FixJ family two-component response regulator